MKTACLLARLDRMPMVKLLAPFAAGIALAARYELRVCQNTLFITEDRYIAELSYKVAI